MIKTFLLRLSLVLSFVCVLALTSCDQPKPEPMVEPKDDKTVLLSVLARNKEHVLPTYLEHIDNLGYDKKLITVYINTNNNIDGTAEILENWAAKNQDNYKKIIVEKYDIKADLSVDPHAWDHQRCFVLGKIRERSLQQAVDNQTDYYFVIDCDNFVKPNTLRSLIAQDKPIIAPLLKPIPQEGDYYSNFHTSVNENGYFDEDPLYYEIFDGEKRGTFEVPLVHCTYLINSNVIDKLQYIDDQDQHEYVAFARSARENGVQQYISNSEDYGVLLHTNEDISLEEEAALMKELYPPKA